jgi:broad specificity phosphatase PhoE
MQTAGLESIQSELKVPNHRVPLSATGMQQALHVGRQLRQLLDTSHLGNNHDGISNASESSSTPGSNGSKDNGDVMTSSRPGRYFFYTSPYLRCIQTAQHMVKALEPKQVRSYGWKSVTSVLLADVL